MAIKETITVTFGDGVAAIRREGTMRVMVAKILGTDTDAAGRVVKVFLDRRVHRAEGRESFVGWDAGGAISTVLTRASQAA